MFENIKNFFKKFSKNDQIETKSKDTAKERLHLVLMQDRANVSADFLELMKQEIIEVIKKYIDVDESAIDVKLTNKTNGDGTVGAPALYANIPIITIKNEARQVGPKEVEEKEESKAQETPVVEEKIEEQATENNEEIKQDNNKDENITEGDSTKKDVEVIVEHEEIKEDEKKEEIKEKKEVV